MLTAVCFLDYLCEHSQTDRSLRRTYADAGCVRTANYGILQMSCRCQHACSQRGIVHTEVAIVLYPMAKNPNRSPVWLVSRLGVRAIHSNCARSVIPHSGTFAVPSLALARAWLTLRSLGTVVPATLGGPARGPPTA